LVQKENQLKQQKTGIVSWLVFLTTISVVLFTFASVMFPFLILGSTGGIKFPFAMNLFETGIWTYPVLLSNIIVFGLAILYFKNKLPTPVTKSFRFIFNFEVSRRVAFWAMVIILAIYIGFSIEEVFADDPWIDYLRYVKPTLDTWTIDRYTGNIVDTYLSFAFGKISGIVFGEYAVSAFMASILLLVLTYLITLEITKKRFAGLIAMLVLIQSGNFLSYDTTITYPNFWVVFLILSLYMFYKKWPISPLSFLLSIPSKVISAMYLPSILFFLYRAKIPRKNKIRICITYGAIVSVALGIVFFSGLDLFSYTVSDIKFNERKFLSGFTAFTLQFRFDPVIIMFMIPLTIGLFIASRNGVKEADSIMVLLLGVLMMAAILPGFSAFTNNPYRFVPFVVFFAMGVGTLLSRRS
jgi:hypothetical protein